MSIGKLKKYHDVGLNATLATASPHKQIDMLFEGALKFLVQAKASIEQDNIEQRTDRLNRASDILFALSDYLDLEKGGEVAENLAALYDYMLRRLREANRDNSVEPCNEVMQLILEIRTGWQGMPVEYK